MLVKLTHAEDFDLFSEWLEKVAVRAVADEYGFVSLGLLYPKTPVLDKRELTNYVITWNALNPLRKVNIV